MIDLHSHVLPGIDDGAHTIDESVALARAAHAEGTHTIVATPHVSARYHNDAATIAELVTELNGRLAGEEVQIVRGAEISATRVPEIAAEELARLGLGGSRCLLVEPPLTSSTAGLDLLVADLHAHDHRVLLAHPERCAGFHRDPRRLQSLLDAGALTSLTAGSFAGRFGAQVRRFAWSMLEAGIVDNVASDFHDLRGRPPGIAGALDSTRLGELVEWLTQAVPEALLADREVPRRPHVVLRAPAQRRRWWARWRRAPAPS